jgi:ketosteroid isomerase-like protein
MTLTNVEVVRRWLPHWMVNDWSRADEWFHPEVEFAFTVEPDLGTTRGIGPMSRAWNDYLNAWETFEGELEDIIDAGEHVVVFGRIRGRGKTSGIEVDAAISNVFTLRDGKIVRLALIPDRDEALRQVGLAKG